MATKTQTTWAELGELDQAIAAGTRRVEQVDAERRAAERDVDRARGVRLSLERDRGAGRDVDDEEVAAALEAIATAEAAADEAVWGARKEGAEEAVEEATRTREGFMRGRFEDLAGELTTADAEITATLNRAWGEMGSAAGAYAIQQRRWRLIAPAGGIDPDSVPAVAPLAGIDPDARRELDNGIQPPTPPTLR